VIATLLILGGIHEICGLLIKVGVAKPVADGCEINPGFHEINRRRVPQRVGMAPAIGSKL
jgi:hypothetical protein